MMVYDGEIVCILAEIPSKVDRKRFCPMIEITLFLFDIVEIE